MPKRNPSGYIKYTILLQEEKEEKIYESDFHLQNKEQNKNKETIVPLSAR